MVVSLRGSGKIRAVKVLIADDHALFRDGMKHLLARLADEVTVLEAGNCGDALATIESDPTIDLVLLDLVMPGADGFTALETLTSKPSAVPVVVLSASERREDMRRALDAGALGFIPKSVTTGVMLSALQLILAGGVYVPPELLSATPPADPPRVDVGLTARQLDVLVKVVEGKPNKVIAAELHLSEATVKTHMTAVFRALNVTNRTQAARTAESIGLVPQT